MNVDVVLHITCNKAKLTALIVTRPHKSPRKKGKVNLIAKRIGQLIYSCCTALNKGGKQ
ncbi:hypothetical protein MPTA7396_3210 [Mycoplasmoides pneumoniae]|nr:hypothetical protein KPI25BX_2670 [Mycoplasmoides pneumoniae]GLL58639.1 hypothetical protein Y1241N_6890 [Mycoplasmoides pneumoniae]GLL59375.1 hypothetical protein Y12242BV_7020 [Mycoplasmoides pneumoniae]GLL59758.1 hypothetical protein Y12382J_3640 [Mycoplasmoides pneumoniae]GLL60466.1 hypothetical protein OA571N_3490 [Mycoplasmoides pneumoniae]